MSIISVTYVVIGGGIAGVSCAETLCQLISSSGKTVLLVSGSTLVRIAANVAQLTQTLLQFDIQEKSAEELQSMTPGLQVLTGVSVTSLDPSNKLICLSNNIKVKYENSVCICTGAFPKKLPGSESCGDLVLTLRDVESVASLEKHLHTVKKVAVIGNGGIATELVYKLRGVNEISWIVRDNYISAAFVDAGAAQFFLSTGAVTDPDKKPEPILKRLRYTSADGGASCLGAALGPDWHTKFDIQGPSGDGKPAINIEFQTEVQHIFRNGEEGFPECDKDWPLSLKLSTGKTIGCDLVVVATGVVPNCEIFKDILDVAPATEGGGGIRVDKLMKTSQADVFAAGDVVFANWPHEKHWFQMRLWTQARQMGCLAAQSMVNAEDAAMFDFSFESFAHITRFFGFKVVLLGLHNGQGLEPGTWDALVRHSPGKEYVKLVILDGKVQGAVLVGDTELEEMCENLILNQTDVSHLGDDLLNPNIDVEDYFD